MDFISLFITVIGILLLLALFIMSRLFERRIKPAASDSKIPTYKDADGTELTSIKADFPATDKPGGSKKEPTINPSFSEARIFAPDAGHNTAGATAEEPQQSAGATAPETQQSTAETAPEADKKPATQATQQFVLFIAATAKQPLDGRKVVETLEAHGMVFGAQDIYHYHPEGSQDSLFRAANGISPWTLVPDKLKLETTPGISLIMQAPLPIPTKQAVQTFVKVARQITDTLDAELLNASQQPFADHEEMLWLSS